MDTARKIMCWLFAISVAFCLWNEFRVLVYISHRNEAFQTVRTWVLCSVLPALGSIYATAWWRIWKGKSSARVWGMVASATFILFPLFGILYPPGSVPPAVWVTFAIGICGFEVFLKQRGNKSIGDVLHGE